LRSGGAPLEQRKQRLESAAQPIEAKRAAHEEQLTALSARWDALVDSAAPQAERQAVLESLRDVAIERNYINNLLAGIERELNA
jgi:hypothetical protein